MKGRKPKPTPLRLVEGNREHRTIHEELEPKPERIAPACPRQLAGEARKAWRYLVRELGKMGTLASSDRAQMAGYSDAWGRWCKAKSVLAALEKQNGRDPEVIQTRTGNWIQSPWMNIANRAMADCIKYGAELGLNPVQRTRVKLDKPQDQSRRGKLLA